MQPLDPTRTQRVLCTVDSLPLLPGKREALRAAALDLLADGTVRGVAIWGSTSCGEPNPRDFDLIVLVTGRRTWTRRRLYRGTSVHMQMRTEAHFRRANLERKQKRSERCPAYAELLVLWDDTGSFAPVRARARRLRARGPRPVSWREVTQLRAELAELVEEMEAKARDRAVFALLAAHCLARAAVIHLRLRGAWVPDTKDALPALDPALAARYREALRLLSRPAACAKQVRALAAEALAPVGGPVTDYDVWWG